LHRRHFVTILANIVKYVHWVFDEQWVHGLWMGRNTISDAQIESEATISHGETIFAAG
jgi:hypothetical protein